MKANEYQAWDAVMFLKDVLHKTGPERQAALDFTPPTAPASFGGKTFEPKKDAKRLRRQYEAVLALMLDGRWRTLRQISDALSIPEASASARLRDLRKPEFAGLGDDVERERVEGRPGLWRYRVNPARAAEILGEAAEALAENRRLAEEQDTRDRGRAMNEGDWRE